MLKINNHSRLVIPLLTLCAAAFLANCGGGSSDTSADQSGNDDTIIKRLVTNWGTGYHEAWSCIDSNGEPHVFTFYDKGEVEGLEAAYLGTKYSVRSNIEPFHYMWKALSNTSIQVESPTLGIRDVWTNVEFSEPASEGEYMRAISGAQGQLQCSLEGEAA